MSKYDTVDKHTACEFCAIRENKDALGAGSGCLTYIGEDGSIYSMCRVCADEEKVVNFCKACNIGCLFDNAHVHGFCIECYEQSINGSEYHDYMVARIEERKEAYDALAREVNTALGLPADDGTFGTFDSCEEDMISIIADKLCDVVLEKFPDLYERTLGFYKDADRYAVEMCNRAASSETEEPEEPEEAEEDDRAGSAAKKQRTQ